MNKKILLQLGFAFGLIASSTIASAAGVSSGCNNLTNSQLNSIDFQYSNAVILNGLVGGGSRLCVAFSLTDKDVTMLSAILPRAQAANQLVSLIGGSSLRVTIFPRP